MRRNHQMKIKVLNTEDAFDPSASCSPEEYNASLTAFECQCRQALLKDYPDAEIEFFRSVEDYEAPTGGVEIEGVDDYHECEAVEAEVLRIIGDIYDTGTFWE